MATPQLVIAWLEGRRASFAFAFQGLRFLMRERNAQIHFAATLVVVCAGALCRVSRFDWLCLIIAIMGVWVAEAFNTALEALANASVPDTHPLVKVAKDVAAGAVLLAAIGAVCIAGLVFVPRMQH